MVESNFADCNLSNACVVSCAFDDIDSFTF